MIDEMEAKLILEKYLDSYGRLGPDESGAEYELDSGYEKKVYAEPAYQFCLSYKPDVPSVGGRKISEWAVTKDGKTIYEYDIVNDIWVEGSVYGFGDFSQTVQERGYLEDAIGTFYIVSPNGR